jgi:putative addiction module component (TIGR02574 family)
LTGSCDRLELALRLVAAPVLDTASADVDGPLLLGYIGSMVIEAMIAEALKLSTDDRTQLVARLLDSLDEKADPGHDVAWAEVIDRRMQDIAEGRVELVDAADAMAQARAVVAARR